LCTCVAQARFGYVEPRHSIVQFLGGCRSVGRQRRDTIVPLTGELRYGLGALDS
jgi:hypothetical protein